MRKKVLIGGISIGGGAIVLLLPILLIVAIISAASSTGNTSAAGTIGVYTLTIQKSLANKTVTVNGIAYTWVSGDAAGDTFTGDTTERQATTLAEALNRQEQLTYAITANQNTVLFAQRVAGVGSCPTITISPAEDGGITIVTTTIGVSGTGSSGAVGTGSSQMVNVALSQVGNVGGAPYWSWYGFHSRVEWCACFVTWCANQCGYIDSGVFPRFAGVNSGGIPWFQAAGCWQDSAYRGGSYTPTAGDIIFIDWDPDGSESGVPNEADHVGLVEKCENGIVYTIEGNRHDTCCQGQFSLDSSNIYGYGTPQYPTASTTTTAA